MEWGAGATPLSTEFWFSKGLKNEFETAVFEPLKFYCTFYVAKQCKLQSDCSGALHYFALTDELFPCYPVEIYSKYIY